MQFNFQRVGSLCSTAINSLSLSLPKLGDIANKDISIWSYRKVEGQMKRIMAIETE
jgi:hypothetical protein